MRASVSEKPAAIEKQMLPLLPVNANFSSVSAVTPDGTRFTAKLERDGEVVEDEASQAALHCCTMSCYRGLLTGLWSSHARDQTSTPRKTRRINPMTKLNPATPRLNPVISRKRLLNGTSLATEM